MNTLTGRKAEVKLLKEALAGKRPELIVIYGRRRVGKTFLVRHTYKNEILFEVAGLHNGRLSDQLRNFSRELQSKFKLSNNFTIPKDWLDAFGLLEVYLLSLKSKKKKVIFLDEFPWFVTPKSNFLVAFENFWNGFASRRSDLIIVICGSAASYIVKNIINNKGGLHNRITRRIRLLPFNLCETEQFLKQNKINYSQYDILQLYMAIGGVPFYLESVKKGESVAQNLDRLCFSKDGILTNEFNLVFSSLFENHYRHISIVKTLASVRKGMTRNHLIKKSKISSGGTFTNTIQELIESGFVTRYLPLEKKSKDTLYRLTDEYSLFYIKFIKDSRTLGAGTWIKLFGSKSFLSWSGFSFETVCLKHIEQIKSALGISAIHSDNSSWIGGNNDNRAQIDMLIDRADNVINLFEIKFSQGEFIINKKYASELRNKLITFNTSSRTKKNIFLTMLTTYGVRENEYSLELLQNNLKMDCLFQF
jgi:AAA+ ATPase superfamily predicted ATPase